MTELSREGWEELVREMEAPPADTPERRATFARVRAMGEVRRRPGYHPGAHAFPTTWGSPDANGGGTGGF